MTNKFRFTQAALMAVAVPPGGKSVTVYDAGQPGLACRVSATGARTMLVYKKVAGRPVRKTLGRLVAKSGRDLQWFRGEAARELGAIAADPVRWLEAEAPADVDKLTVAEAFDRALAGTSRGALARVDWHQKVRRFGDWLREHYPHVTRWVEIRRGHMLAYGEEVRQGRAPNTIRLALQPLIQTGGYLSRKFEIPDPSLALRGLGGSRLKSLPPRIALTDALGLLDWLREHRPWLEAGASLQSLAGLRVLETLRLEWRHVDLEEGRIQVAAVEAKNPYARRLIPIPQRALEALRRAANNRLLGTVEALDAKLVVSASGKPFYISTERLGWYEHGRAMTEAIKAWNPAVRWRSKDLRNVLPQLAVDWGGALLELYYGHAAGSVTARNYAGPLATATEGEIELQDEITAKFRREIVDRIDQAVEAHYAKRGATVEAVERAKR
jgi:integrase